MALVLAVDVSASMNPSEMRMQREGYVNAFRHPDLLWSIRSGGRGKIAVAYLEWAGPDYQHVLIPWTVIDGPGAATAFADRLAAMPLSTGAGTSISGALAAAGNLLATTGMTSDRWVVDVSGDGPNNVGPAIAPVRDRLVEQGTTINGLAITLRRGAPDLADAFGGGYIEAYYEDCVIGGPDAFVVSVGDIAQFEVSIRMKLIREIAALPRRLVPAADRSPAKPTQDCLAAGHSPGR